MHAPRPARRAPLLGGAGLRALPRPAAKAIQPRLHGVMHEPLGGAPEAFADFAAWGARIWTRVIKEAGVRAE